MENNMGEHKKGLKAVIIIVAMVLVAAVVVVSILRDRLVNPNQNQISVAGQGRVAYQPDTANILLGVQVDKAVNADEALKKINDKVAKIYDAVLKLGIPKENIKTQNYSLFPAYDYIGGISQAAGYNASETVVIKVSDITSENSLLSKVIAAAIAAGANQINSVTFENSKINDLRQEARLKAIDDAKSKASVVAQALGVRLKKITGWWENYVATPDVPTYYYGDVGGKGGAGGSVGSSGPTLPVGSQDLIVEVNISYQIK